LIGESLESLIQNNVGGNPEAGTVQRQGQIKELLVGVKSSTFSLPQSGRLWDGVRIFLWIYLLMLGFWHHLLRKTGVRDPFRPEYCSTWLHTRIVYAFLSCMSASSCGLSAVARSKGDWTASRGRHSHFCSVRCTERTCDCCGVLDAHVLTVLLNYGYFFISLLYSYN